MRYLSRAFEEDSVDLLRFSMDGGNLKGQRFIDPEDSANLDTGFEEVGCFIERPAALADWALENRDSLEDGEYLKQKFAWYAEDAGKSTVEAVVRLMEAAANGQSGC